MLTTEERVETLETVLQRFIIQTDSSIQGLSRQIDRISKEVDRVSKEVDRLTHNIQRQSEELALYREEARIERIEMNKRWGEIANKMGTLVEDMVAPNIKGIAKTYFACNDLEDFMLRRQKRHSKDRSKRKEFDIIALCDDKVILNETKSTARKSYVDEFIVTIKEFFDYFPEYEGKRIIPIFASLYISDDVITYLTDREIYAMAIKEDTMDLLNFQALS